MELCPVSDQEDCMSHATFIDQIWWYCEEHNHMYICVGQYCVYYCMEPFPKWNSTPRCRQARKYYKKSHGARKYACNLCASKKLCLTNAIVSQEDTTRWGEKFQHFGQFLCTIKHVK